jgi:hypothetical protein
MLLRELDLQGRPAIQFACQSKSGKCVAVHRNLEVSNLPSGNEGVNRSVLPIKSQAKL